MQSFKESLLKCRKKDVHTYFWNGWIDKQTDGQTNKWTDQQMDRPTDGKTTRHNYIDVHCIFLTKTELSLHI